MIDSRVILVLAAIGATIFLAATPCPSFAIDPARVRPAQTSGRPPACLAVTIDQLWRNPLPFEGRPVCVRGLLGRMVPYGEDRPELYSTRRDATHNDSNHYLVLGFPFTIPVQERLSRHSLQPLQAEGIFQLEFPCQPAERSPLRDTPCDPPPDMRLAHARLVFRNGARFGYPLPRR
jgi:hypothetical protein